MVPIYSINMQLVMKWTLRYLHNVVVIFLPDHTATTMVDWCPSKINGVSGGIIIYESTPKKLDPSQTSRHTVQCSSTAPADWEEVLAIHKLLLILIYSHEELHLHHPSLRSTTVSPRMDFQCLVITVNNSKQRHRRDALELHILSFSWFLKDFLSKSDWEHMLQLKRRLTTAKAE